MPLYFRSAATEEPAHAAAEEKPEQPQEPQESLDVEMLNWWGVDPLARTALKLMEESGDSGVSRPRALCYMLSAQRLLMESHMPSDR